MLKQDKILLRTQTAEALYRHITELITSTPWHIVTIDPQYYHRCNELLIMNLERDQILKKIQAAERKAETEVKLTFNRLALQVLVNNIPPGVGCDGFIGEAMKHVKVNYLSI